MRLAAFLVTLMLLWSGPAHAEPISTAIGLTALITSLGVGASVAGAIGGGLITLGVSVGLNFLSSALAQKPSNATDTTPAGVQSTLQVGATTPRNVVVGEQLAAGTLIYWNLYGANNENLQLVFALAAGPHELRGVVVNGQGSGLDAAEGTLGQGIYNLDHNGSHTAWLQFHHGFADQVADAELVANANPAGRWSANNRGSGVCYVRITLRYVPEAYPQGIPQFGFVIGARLYDIRKDSSSGGDGAHRWSDQHSWEWSPNAVTALYLFERGLYTNGVKQVGRGLAPVDIVTDLFIGGANVCDENVALKAGGFEPRYRIAMNIGADRDFASVEQDFCTAFGGWMMETAGAYGPIPGAARPVAFTFTTRDILPERTRSFSPKRSRSELVNAVYGTFSDPAQNYTAVPYPARRSSADAIADGGEFAAKHDYLMISSATQAQRVGEIERRLSRYQATGSLTLGFAFSVAEQGDWCTWTDSPVGAVTFQITQYQLDAGQAITLTLREIAAAAFDFDEESDELDPLAPGDLPGIGALITVPQSFGADQVTLNGPDGLKHPAIRTLWSPITDRTVDSVIVQYRLAAQPGDVSDAGPFPPEDGEGIIAAGIQANGAYEVRATITTTPVRTTAWTEWKPVHAPSDHVVPFAQGIGAGGADWTSLSEEVKERFAAVDAARERAEQILAATQIAAKLADFERRLRSKTDIKDADERLGTRITFTQQTVSDLSGEFAAYQVLVAAQLGDITANATSLLEAMATQQAAFAAFQLTVNTQLGDLSSTVNTQGSALSTLNESVASLESTVTASLGDLTSTVTTLQEAVATIDSKLVGVWGVTLDVHNHISGIKLISDGSTSTFTVAVDAFQIASPSIAGGAGKTVFQVGTRGGVADVVMKGTMIVDGGIITNSLSGDAAFYSRDVAVGAGNLTYGNNTNTTFVILSETVTVAKNHLQIFASHFGSGSILYPNDSASIAVYVDGAPIFGGTITGYTNSVSSNTIGLNGTVTTSVYGLAPGTHTVAIVVSLHSDAATAGNPQRRYDRSQAVLIVGEPRNPEGT